MPQIDYCGALLRIAIFAIIDAPSSGGPKLRIRETCDNNGELDRNITALSVFVCAAKVGPPSRTFDEVPLQATAKFCCILSALGFPMADSVDELITKLQLMKYIDYINIASVCLWAYDYMLTLDLEISLIWGAQWNVPKALFLLTRYIPIIDSTADMYFFFHPGNSDTTCLAMCQIAEWMFVIGVGFAEIILMIRAWAVWERDRKLSIGLPIFFVAVWSTLCVYTARYLRSLKFTPTQSSALPGCWIAGRSSIQFVAWALVTGFEGVILMLMCIKGYQTLRMGPSSGLARLIYVDGVLYYMALFALALINMAIILTLPEGFGNFLTTFQRIMHSVLTGRMLLQLRQYNRRTVHGDGLTEFTGVSIPLEFLHHTTSASGDGPASLEPRS